MAKKKEKTSKKGEPKNKPMKAASGKGVPVKKDASEKKSVKPEPKMTKPAKPELPKPAPVKAPATKTPAPQPLTPGTGKKRLMISYEKLPPEVIEVIRTKYPYGYNHDLKEVKGIDNKKFFVLPIELPDAVYLVKVDLRKPIKIQDTEDEEDIFTPEEEFTAGEEDNFPSEDLEQMEGDDEGAEEEPKKKKKREEEDEEE